MWQTILENVKLIIGTITAVAIFSVGAWEITTGIFLTKAEAQTLIKKLDLDTSYNKAFRLEEKIIRMIEHSQKYPLTADQNKTLKRYKRDLNRTDRHIEELEQKIYQGE